MGRGGARQGCGRKPLGDNKRVRITITVAPDTAQRLRELNRAGKMAIKQLGRVADDYILNHEG